MTTSPEWIFDDSEIPDPFGYGQRAVDFLRLLKHPKSTAPGRAFQLMRWQERLVRRIYGPRHPDGSRIVRTVVILLPRGNRKTALGAALGALHHIGPERVPGGQIICAGSDREQARIGFVEAASIYRAVPQIEQAVRFLDYRHEMKHPKSGSVLRAISCDANRQHGGTPTFALVDELHAWLRRDLWDVLRTGLTKTAGTLMVVITTAGRGQENVAWDIVDYARKVARGEIDDPATLPVLFEAGTAEDWRDEDLWYRVNPGLADGFPDIEGLRQLAREAMNRPADRDAFRQLHLNCWLDHSASPFCEMDVWDRGADPVDEADLTGPCWLAVDLSSTTDLTAIVGAWPDGAEGYRLKAWFFCPGDNLRARADRDHVPYPRWAEEGHIEPTPGNVVDYLRVEGKIRELCDRYDVREIAFDPHLAQQTMTRLGEEGFPVAAMRQGWVTLAPAIRELERAIISGKLKHGGHPVLRWNIENVNVHVDSAGNRMFHKGKSKDRIDGAVAAAMAVGRAAVNQFNGSVFDSDEWTPDLCVA